MTSIKETYGRQSKCACEGATLERLVRPALLIILAGSELHGYRIVQRLAEMSMFDGNLPNASGVYRTLNTMSGEGLVDSAWEISEVGPARKLYKITPEGRKCLAVWMVTLSKYRFAVDGLLEAGRIALDMGTDEGLQ